MKKIKNNESRIYSSKQKGFTLAETLITLTILGIIAAITVPMLINKQIEAAKRTKLKKAMATYEKALNQMIIEHDIKSGPISEILGFRAADDCSSSTTYFKKINGDGCRFQTADKVYWDISDIEHPVISLKDEITAENASDFIGYTKSADNNEVFGMVGKISNGIVRINDRGVATGDDAIILNKIYAFIENQPIVSGSNYLTESDYSGLPYNEKAILFKTANMRACGANTTIFGGTEQPKNCVYEDEYDPENKFVSRSVYDENGNEYKYGCRELNGKGCYHSFYCPIEGECNSASLDDSDYDVYTNYFGSPSEAESSDDWSSEESSSDDWSSDESSSDESSSDESSSDESSSD